MPQEALDWVKKMIDYNVKGGKLNRGLTVRLFVVAFGGWSSRVCTCVQSTEGANRLPHTHTHTPSPQ